MSPRIWPTSLLRFSTVSFMNSLWLFWLYFEWRCLFAELKYCTISEQNIIVCFFSKKRIHFKTSVWKCQNRSCCSLIKVKFPLCRSATPWRCTDDLEVVFHCVLHIWIWWRWIMSVQTRSMCSRHHAHLVRCCMGPRASLVLMTKREIANTVGNRTTV